MSWGLVPHRLSFPRDRSPALLTSPSCLRRQSFRVGTDAQIRVPVPQLSFGAVFDIAGELFDFFGFADEVEAEDFARVGFFYFGFQFRS